jgi:hypothetical protein
VLIDHLSNIGLKKGVSTSNFHKKDGLRSQMAGQTEQKAFK